MSCAVCQRAKKLAPNVVSKGMGSKVSHNLKKSALEDHGNSLEHNKVRSKAGSKLTIRPPYSHFDEGDLCRQSRFAPTPTCEQTPGSTSGFRQTFGRR